MFMSRPGGGSTKSQAPLVQNEPEHVSSRENVGDEAEPGVESKCTACSFEKSAIIGTLITIILIGVFVIALDISIDQVRRTDEAEYYKSFVNYSLTLQGTPEEYAVFYPLSYHEVQGIRRVDMNYVQLNISEFFYSFKYSRKPQSIKFRNMRFVGKVSKSRRIGFTHTYRPEGDIKADVMIVEFNQSMGPFTTFQLDECDKCVLNVLEPDNLTLFQDVDCLKSALMLPVHEFGSFYLISNRLQLKSRMKVKVFGWNFFDLDSEAGILTSLHTDSEKILQNLIQKSIGLKQLHLRNCQIQLSTLSNFSSTLTHLTLDTVNITGATGRLSEIFSNFSQLQELTLKLGNSLVGKRLTPDALAENHLPFYAPVSISNPFTVDFTDLPSTLKVLRLSNVVISGENYRPPSLRVHLHLKLLVVQGIIFIDQQSWDMIQDTAFLQYEELAWQYLNYYLEVRLIRAHARTGRKFGTPDPNVSWLTFLKRKTSQTDATQRIFIDNVIELRGDTPTDEGGSRELFETIGVSREALRSHSQALVLEKAASRNNEPAQWKGRHIPPADADMQITSLWFKALNMEVFLDKDYSLSSKW